MSRIRRVPMFVIIILAACAALAQPAKRPIKLDDLVPKLKAIIEARHGDSNEVIYVRGDKKVDYGTMMRVMGRISGAGYHRVALVTNIEQNEQ